MELLYLSYSERPIMPSQLMKLYKDASWWEERKDTDIKNILESGISVGVWKDNDLIGFARAVTDGKFRAYVEDVMIYSTYQQSGIGKELVAFLLSKLSHIDVISLFCEDKLIPFYTANHFKYSKSQFVMHRKNC